MIVSRLAITLLVVGCMLFIAWGSAFAKGRPWNISIYSAADADGGTIQITVTLEGPNLPDAPVIANVTIPGGRTAVLKCQDIASALDLSRHLESSCSGTTVKVEVQDNSPFSEIKGIQIDDSQTGEDLTGVKDDPDDQVLLMRAFFEFQGNSEAEGEANLKIGNGPLVTVPTSNMVASDIAQSLVSAFNENYAERNYTAKLFGELVVIDSVPCQEGITAGTSDSSLDFSFGMIRVIDSAKASSFYQWIIIIVLVMLLFGVLFWAMNLRKGRDRI